MSKTAGLMALSVFPLACLCLSANTVRQDKSIVIGPLLDGETLRVQLRIFKGNYPSDYRVFFDARGVNFPQPPTGFDQMMIGDLPEEEGYGYFSSTLSSFYMKAGEIVHVEMGICKEAYRRGIDGSKMPFVFRRDFQIKTGSHFYQIDEDGIFETRNHVYHIDEAHPSEEVLSHDSYEVQGLCLGSDIGGRKVPLDRLYVDYFGFGALPIEGTTAELRLLNYVGDFDGIATKKGDYASIPLSASCQKRAGDVYRYRFALKESYYYSRVDFKASKRAFRNEPYFLSDAFFLPLRQGHDDEAYRFQIVMEKAGAFGDTVLLENRAYSSRSYFGNCLESEYCVVAGGN